MDVNQCGLLTVGVSKCDAFRFQARPSNESQPMLVLFCQLKAEQPGELGVHILKNTWARQKQLGFLNRTCRKTAHGL